ncbi:hypothetical protein [Pseudomonas sp.]|uniref:hypothetical protein n=1 Tax=Pseudomonas sp. TaxID=306 RepID=UPI0035A153A6
MYQRGKAFLEVNVPPKIIDSDMALSLWKKARGILGLSRFTPSLHFDRIGGCQAGFSRPVWSLRLASDQCGRTTNLEDAMGALRAAQWQFDEELPPSVSESPQDAEEQAWVSNGVAELIGRRDYIFPFKGRQIGVTFERLALAVDEHAMGELSGSSNNTVLGRLILSAVLGGRGDAKSDAVEILAVPDPIRLFEQLAIDLLTPFAREGVLAQAEAEL